MISEYFAVCELERISHSSTCCKRKVGCFVIKDEKILLEAANGMPNIPGKTCQEGGCPRCKKSGRFAHGTQYDLCFCLHAEERVIAKAAREGIAIRGAWLYTSYQPCIMCLRKIIEAGIDGVRFIEEWELPDVNLEGLEETYMRFVASFSDGFKKLLIS